MIDKYKDNKDFYSEYSDNIIVKRFESPNKLRRYVHRQQYLSFLSYIKPGTKVLDVGCGEGVLSVMMAKLGAIVTACDISKPNIDACIKYAKEEKIVNINFSVADSEKLPFDNNSFDLVVSSHVLEHLPDFDKGLIELMRVTKKRAIVAIPTVMNLCSLVQVGRGAFWYKGKRVLFALPFGILRMLSSLMFFKEGVNEFYAGNKDLIHIFRFPWIMKRKLKKLNFKLVEYEASSLCVPYFQCLLSLIKFLDKYKTCRVLKNLGYGTTYVVEK
jgi:ubiquinone/menaquinone biosynthesis C-methylase UbiE